ncbi:hypothetical protein [Nonomuraea sp. NPDC003214]
MTTSATRARPSKGCSGSTATAVRSRLRARKSRPRARTIQARTPHTARIRTSVVTSI